MNSTGHDFKKSGNETRNADVDVLFKVVYLHFFCITSMLSCQKIQVPFFSHFLALISFTVQDADCSSNPCGDTTNFVCESNLCKGKSLHQQHRFFPFLCLC